MTVQYATLVFDAGASFRGVHGVLEPSEYVYDTETSALVLDKPIAFSLDSNGVAQVSVPHTHSATYTDHFTYTVQWAVPAGHETPGYKEFVIPEDATTVNFDDLPFTPSGSGEAGAGFSDGHTGAVYVEYGVYDSGFGGTLLEAGVGGEWVGAAPWGSRTPWLTPLPISYYQSDASDCAINTDLDHAYTDAWGGVQANLGGGSDVLLVNPGWYLVQGSCSVVGDPELTSHIWLEIANKDMVHFPVYLSTDPEMRQTFVRPLYLSGPITLKVIAPPGTDLPDGGSLTLRRLWLNLVPMFAI